MKNFKLVLFFLVSVLAFNVQAQTTSKAVSKNDVQDKGVTKTQVTFKESTHDFGTINEGDSVETTFEFTNTGQAPLFIESIKASCGCTVPSNWSKEAIQPGEEGSFTVKFNSNNKPNRQSKRITMTCNTEKGVEYVTIKAQVNPDAEKEALRAERRKVVLEKRKEKEAKLKAEAEAAAKEREKQQMEDKRAYNEKK